MINCDLISYVTCPYRTNDPKLRRDGVALIIIKDLLILNLKFEVLPMKY